MARSRRLWGLDLLKLGAACVVILLHTVPSLQIQHLMDLIASHDEAVRPFLICSGYLWAMAAHRRQADTPLAYYRRVFPRWLAQILIPYTLLYGVEVLYHCFWVTWNDLNTWYYPFLNGDPRGFYRIREMAAMFLSGGPGPGGYYISLLFQLLLLFPFLRWFYLKWPRIFFCLTLGVTAAAARWGFDFWTPYLKLAGLTPLHPLAQDRLLVFLMGIATYQLGIRWRWWHLLLFGGGALVFYRPALQLSILCIMETLLLAGICLSRLPLPSPLEWLSSHLGRASYFIFLFQKAYCATGITYLLVLQRGQSQWWAPFLCLTGGILYYILYSLGKKLFFLLLPTKKKEPALLAS